MMRSGFSRGCDPVAALGTRSRIVALQSVLFAACEKIVTSAGGIITADIYASGVYTVIAKAPAAPGLTWAVWTYHYELHVPQYVPFTL